MSKQQFIVTPEGLKEVQPDVEVERQMKDWEKELEDLNRKFAQAGNRPVEEQSQMWKRIQELKRKLGILKEEEQELTTGVYL